MSGYLLKLRCPRCEQEWGARAASCPSCGCRTLQPIPHSRNGIAYGEPGCRPRRRRRPDTTDLASLVQSTKALRRCRWGLEGFTLPPTAKLAVEGPPGGGKSTLASRVAVDLAAQGHRVLNLSVEEGQEEPCIGRLQRACRLVGVPPASTLLVADVRDIHEADQELVAFRAAGSKGVVIVDSLSELDASPTWWSELMVDPWMGVVVVQHLTTAGQPRGGLAPAYACQVRLVVNDLQAQVVKNRFGPCQVFSVLSPLAAAPETGRVVPFPKES